MDFIYDYIKQRKKCEDFELANFPLIDYTIESHQSVFKEMEIIPVYSADIFPEILRYDNKNYIIYDLHFTEYIRLFITNLVSIKYDHENNNSQLTPQLLDNIRSDIYYFLACRNYRNETACFVFFNRSKELFSQLNIVFKNDGFIEQYIFITNLFLIRHEIAHACFKIEDSAKHKSVLQEQLLAIADLLDKGYWDNPDPHLTSLLDFDFEVLKGKEIGAILRQIATNQNAILFEEIFCDWLAFRDIILITKLKTPGRKELSYEAAGMLSVFDYMNEIYRQLSLRMEYILKNNEQIELKPVTTIRHTIGHLLRPFIILFESGPEEFKTTASNEFYDSINFYQDLIFKHIYPVIGEITKDENLILQLLD